MGFNRRFAPLVRNAIEAVGEVSLVQMEKYRTGPDGFMSRDAIYDDVIHLIDTLVLVGGADVELNECVKREDREGHLLLSSGTLVSKTCVARFAMHRKTGADFERLSICGDGASAEIVNLEQMALRTFDAQAATSEVTQTGSGSWDSIARRRGFSPMIDHVIDSLEEPQNCSISALQLIRTHEIVETLCDSPAS